MKYVCGFRSRSELRNVQVIYIYLEISVNYRLGMNIFDARNYLPEYIHEQGFVELKANIGIHMREVLLVAVVEPMSKSEVAQTHLNVQDN